MSKKRFLKCSEPSAIIKRKYSKWIFKLLMHKSKVVFMNLDKRETLDKFQELKKYSQEDEINAYSNICTEQKEQEPPKRAPVISKPAPTPKPQTAPTSAAPWKSTTCSRKSSRIWRTC